MAGAPPIGRGEAGGWRPPGAPVFLVGCLGARVFGRRQEERHCACTSSRQRSSTKLGSRKTRSPPPLPSPSTSRRLHFRGCAIFACVCVSRPVSSSSRGQVAIDRPLVCVPPWRRRSFGRGWPWLCPSRPSAAPTATTTSSSEQVSRKKGRKRKEWQRKKK